MAERVETQIASRVVSNDRFAGRLLQVGDVLLDISGSSVAKDHDAESFSYRHGG